MTPPWSSEESLTDRDVTDTVTVQPEQLFRAIFEQAAVGVALIETATGRFVRVNQRYGEIVGLAQDAMTATTFMAITHPDDLQADLNNMEALKAGRIRDFCMAKRYFRSDGAIVWVDLTVSPLWEVGEQPSFHIAVVQDITERKRTEALLETDKCILQLIASGGSLSEVLDRLCRMFDDMSPGLLSSVLLLDHDRLRHGAAPNLPSSYCEAIDGVHIGPRVGSCGTAAYLQQQVIVADIAQNPLWADYREIALKHHLRACWSTPVFSENQSVLGTFAMYYRESRNPSAYDLKISEHATKLAAIAIQRAQTEEAMRGRVQFNKAILDSLSAYVAVLDRMGAIVAVNRAWQRAAAERSPLGHSTVSLGLNYLEICRQAATTDHEVQQTLEGIHEVLSRERELFETEYVCLTPEGRRWFSLRVTPLGGHDGGAVVAHEDITPRKCAEEALRDSYRRLQVLSREVQLAKERERSRLSRELHDEFGQVLTGLKFDLTDVAGTLVKNRSGPVTALHQKTTRALGMVDRLFASLRGMVSALRPPLLEELGLVPALESLATDIQGRSGLRCDVVVDRVTFGPRCGIEVESAIYRMTQELLTNVVRHAKATSVTITLSRTDAWVKLMVEDDGRGFETRHVRKTNQFGLRGIRERAELLGGLVEIDSTPRVGTVVTIQIPLELPAPRQKPVVPVQWPKSATTRKRRWREN